MKYVYVKMYDKGLLDDQINLVQMDEKSSDSIAKLLDLEIDLDPTTNNLCTTLRKMGAKGAELISVTPYEKEEVGRKTRIKNIYIFKIEDPKEEITDDLYIE